MGINKNTLAQRARDLLNNMWNSILLFIELPIGSTSNPNSELYLLEHVETDGGVRYRPTRVPLSAISGGSGGGESLAQTLVIGNISGGRNIVMSDGDYLDFTAAGINTNTIVWPNGTRIAHVAGGLLDWFCSDIEIRNIAGQKRLSLNASGSIEVGSPDINGSIAIWNATTNNTYTIITPNITGGRFFVLPDSNIVWTGGSSGDVMTQQPDGSWAPSPAGGGGGTPSLQDVMNVGSSAVVNTSTSITTTFSVMYVGNSGVNGWRLGLAEGEENAFFINQDLGYLVKVPDLASLSALGSTFNFLFREQVSTNGNIYPAVGAVDFGNGVSGDVFVTKPTGALGFGGEEDIRGNALYDGTVSGTPTFDLTTFTDYYMILTGNTTLNFSNTPPVGRTFVRSLTIKSNTTESLAFPASWIVVGEYFADGQENNLEIKFTNYPTEGLKVWCFINQETV